uniref:Uncharacterized protein n=1 Tax=Arundo donax TaxID=35708 RepID=A0A0A9EFL2_ARUDO
MINVEIHSGQYASCHCHSNAIALSRLLVDSAKFLILGR